jgi:hypothetical protein
MGAAASGKGEDGRRDGMDETFFSIDGSIRNHFSLKF